MESIKKTLSNASFPPIPSFSPYNSLSGNYFQENKCLCPYLQVRTSILLSLSLCMYNSTYSIKVFIEHKEFKYVHIYTYVLEFFI